MGGIRETSTNRLGVGGCWAVAVMLTFDHNLCLSANKYTPQSRQWVSHRLFLHFRCVSDEQSPGAYKQGGTTDPNRMCSSGHLVDGAQPKAPLLFSFDPREQLRAMDGRRRLL